MALVCSLSVHMMITKNLKASKSLKQIVCIQIDLHDICEIRSLANYGYSFLAQAIMDQPSAATEPSSEQSVDGMSFT